MAFTDFKDGVDEASKVLLPDVLVRIDRLIAVLERLETTLPTMFDGYTLSKKGPTGPQEKINE